MVLSVWPDYIGRRCPLKLSAEPFSKCVSVHVWMGNDGMESRQKLLCLCFYLECIIVSVSFSTNSANCTSSYSVPDPAPKFSLSLDQQSKSINVTLQPAERVPVYTRLCYRKNPKDCLMGQLPSTRITIDPSQSWSAVLDVPYLLPCLCVQVNLLNVRDVWNASSVTLYESSVTWSSPCHASYLRPSASLCWRQNEHLCTPVSNSTLQEVDDTQYLRYNISAVDKHLQMCVQFSLEGSRNIHCLFKSDMSSWEAHIGPGRQSLLVYLTSSVPAKFSAQLCILSETGCTSKGLAHSVRMVSVCVCVCTHRRYGMLAVAVLVFVVIVALLVILIHRLAKNGAAGWLSIQRPVLLVCSSEASAHLSAVFSLASILQGELCAPVRMALWDQSSQKQARAGTGVADLGPLPWLYGQWEEVHKAQGKVLIIWSPDANKSYEKWRVERAKSDGNKRRKEDGRTEMRHEKTGVDREHDWKVKERRLKKCRKDKAAVKEEFVKLFNNNEQDFQKDPSSVTGPVFIAALARLLGALQECKDHGAAFVYFQGLGHSRDIPKDFRGVPRYGLPQDFRALILGLGGMGTKSDQFRWHCSARLLSKLLSLWLAQRLAHRLRALLTQTETREKKTQGLRLKSSQEMMSGHSGLKLPPSVTMTRPGTLHEQEPLHRSPWKGEAFEAQVSLI
uniref:SEFIR domain-containing protein n=1 Tax=Myripristis murdjan TaxID=586833 RepID=A0A667ZRK6_9TELE